MNKLKLFKKIAGLFFLPAILFFYSGCEKPPVIPTIFVEKVYSGSSALSSVYFSDALHGFAGGDNGIILVTNDGGNSWSRATLRNNEDANFNCISFPSKDTGWISGEENSNSINSGPAIYRTNDGGATWTFHSGCPDMIFTSFPTTSVGYRNVYDTDIEKTTDGGQTWNNLFSAPNANLYYQNLFFINKDTGFVGTDFQFRTTNGGSSWAWSHTSPDYSAADLDFADKLHGIAVFYDGHIDITSDAGATWEASFSPNTDHSYPLYAVTMPSTNVIFAGGLNFLNVSVDGGNKWEQYFQQDGTSFPGEIRDIYFYDERNGFAVTYEGSIYRLKRGN